VEAYKELHELVPAEHIGSARRLSDYQTELFVTAISADGSLTIEPSRFMGSLLSMAREGNWTGFNGSIDELKH
jgi:hypothetical protein